MRSLLFVPGDSPRKQQKGLASGADALILDLEDSVALDAKPQAREITREAFDFVAKEPGASGHLVGDTFTAADLTCAALLMPAVPVDEWGGPKDATTTKNARWLDQWRDHPGAEWVRETFRRYRKTKH